MSTTFAWTSSDGKTFDVEPDYEIDNWTGRELRTIERIGGGSLPSGHYSTLSMIFAVAVARQVPGYTIESADAEMTFGKVQAAYREIRAKEVAAAEAEAAAAEPVEEGAAVLSPTRLDEPGDTQPDS